MKMGIVPSFLLLGGLFFGNTIAYAGQFTYKGVQVGKEFETCYHNPCSGARVVKFSKLNQTADSAMLELTLLGYSRDWASKKNSGIKNHIKFM